MTIQSVHLCRETLGFHPGFELTCVALKMGVFAEIALIIRKAIIRAAVPENLFFTGPGTSNQRLLGFGSKLSWRGLTEPRQPDSPAQSPC
jgi:hypothetical protein